MEYCRSPLPISSVTSTACAARPVESQSLATRITLSSPPYMRGPSDLPLMLRPVVTHTLWSPLKQS
ncbi:hypothetical protein BC628DRAFT_1387040 [Trametes gibbosa]|nr:hypothetical protein BC628DRAFT_1387040 [Trametes gibbosa]